MDFVYQNKENGVCSAWHFESAQDAVFDMIREREPPAASYEPSTSDGDEKITVNDRFLWANTRPRSEWATSFIMAVDISVTERSDGRFTLEFSDIYTERAVAKYVGAVVTRYDWWNQAIQDRRTYRIESVVGRTATASVVAMEELGRPKAT